MSVSTSTGEKIHPVSWFLVVFHASESGGLCFLFFQLDKLGRFLLGEQ